MAWPRPQPLPSGQAPVPSITGQSEKAGKHSKPRDTRRSSHLPPRSPSLDPTQRISCQPPHLPPQPDTSFKLQNISSKQSLRTHHQHENTHIFLYENPESISWTHTLECEDSGHASARCLCESTEGPQTWGLGAPHEEPRRQDTGSLARPACSPSSSSTHRTGGGASGHWWTPVVWDPQGSCTRPQTKLEP